MEQSPSQQSPSPTPATSGSGQAEYWCYYCDTTALVKTLADCSQIVCRECNGGFVELISSIAVSAGPDHFTGPQMLGLFAESMIREDDDVDDDEFADENDGGVEQNGDAYDDDEEERVIDYEIEEDCENEDDDGGIEEDGESDDEYDEDGEWDDDDGEGEQEEEEQRIENMYNNSALETGISEFFDLENLRAVIGSLAALLSDYELERVSLEDYEDQTDGDGRTGAPPAAESVVSSLKTVDVVVENDVRHCAVCKDLVSVGEVAKELECGHGYHEECILPWLGLRNTCPLCRFEMPTDDADYEEKRKKKLADASVSGNNPGLG